MSDESLIDAVRAHAARVFPGRRLETLVWDEGGIVQNLPEFAVLRVAPAVIASAPSWIHLTAGASAAPMKSLGAGSILRPDGKAPVSRRSRAVLMSPRLSRSTTGLASG